MQSSATLLSAPRQTKATVVPLCTQVVLGNLPCEIRHPHRIPPLVVVPCVYLDHSALHNHCAVSVHNPRPVVIDVIGRYKRPVLKAQNAFEGCCLTRCLQQSIHLLLGRLPGNLKHAVCDAPVRQGDPHGKAVEFALELWKHLSNGCRRACRRRRQIDHARPPPPKVLLLARVALVDESLRPRDVVDGRDHALVDAEVLVNHLDYRGEAVGSARCGSANHVVRSELLIIDAHHDIEHRGLLDGRRDDDPLDAPVEVGLERRRREKVARALQHHVAPKLLPRDPLDRRGVGEADLLVADGEGLAIGSLAALVAPPAVH
mmetsp:Transcript_7157/g.17290  ORF Transcript_7157/g.17290 Transcript_7157/m.17290 type:complete len:317 (+) Transcript_7157:130-1080(+)